MKHWQKQIDLAEKSLLLVFYIMLLCEFLSSNGSLSLGLQDGIFLTEETFMVLFVAFRRPAAYISTSPYEWGVSLGGAVASTLYRPSTLHAVVSPALVTMIAFVGLIVEWLGKLSLGRSIGVIPAHRMLKTTGVYRLVRHPIYAGYSLIYISIALGAPSPRNLAVLALTIVGLILRMQIEERLLSQDSDYQKYMMRVRYRMLPGFF